LSDATLAGEAGADRRMIYFHCNVCQAHLSAEENQAGSMVRCPTCLTTLTVPAANQQLAGQTVGAGWGSDLPDISPPPQKPASARPPAHRGLNSGGGTGRRYGFNCAYCSSRLEATEAMAAQEGQCPTCGNAIVIPILDRYGRLIDPITKQIIKPDPHPVHAYAAAGDRAPAILRQADGTQLIQCAKCRNRSSITANNCKQCGMPFTMEGTTPEAAGASNGFAVTSLVLGIIGIPFFCTIIVPLLAIVFGVVALMQIGGSASEGGGGRGLAIAGIVCGGIGFLIGMITYLS
jgi:DNA-directed RNA polymerase subunit RPC12/RpoP